MLRIEEIAGAMDDEFRLALMEMESDRLTELTTSRLRLDQLRPVGVSHAQALSMIKAILEHREWLTNTVINTTASGKTGPARPLLLPGPTKAKLRLTQVSRVIALPSTQSGLPPIRLAAPETDANSAFAQELAKELAKEATGPTPLPDFLTKPPNTPKPINRLTTALFAVTAIIGLALLLKLAGALH